MRRPFRYQANQKRTFQPPTVGNSNMSSDLLASTVPYPCSSNLGYAQAPTCQVQQWKYQGDFATSSSISTGAHIPDSPNQDRPITPEIASICTRVRYEPISSRSSWSYFPCTTFPRRLGAGVPSTEAAFFADFLAAGVPFAALGTLILRTLDLTSSPSSAFSAASR